MSSSTLPSASSAPNDATLPHAVSAQLANATVGDNAQLVVVDGNTAIAMRPQPNSNATFTVAATAAPDVQPSDAVVVQLTYKTDASPTAKRAVKRAVLSECTLTMIIGNTVIYSNRIWTTDGSYTTVTSMPTSSGLTNLVIVQYCPATTTPITIANIAVAPASAANSSSGTATVIASSTVITISTLTPVTTFTSTSTSSPPSVPAITPPTILAATTTGSTTSSGSVTPSSTKSTRPGITPFSWIPTLAVPTTVTETNCPYPTAANWYTAGCTISGAPLQLSGLVAVATGVPAPPAQANTNQPFEAAYQACAQMCASMFNCYSWALDRGYWPTDSSPWTCYFYSAGARLLTPSNQGQNWIVWMDKKCYDCGNPSAAASSTTPSVSSSSSGSLTVLAAAGSSTTSSTSTPSSSSASSTVSATSGPSATATSFTTTSAPSGTVTTFSAPPLLTPCGAPTAAQFYTNGCIQSGYPTATSALLAVATGIAPNAAGDFNFDPVYQRCASICAGLTGCQGYALDRTSTAEWNCNFYSLPVKTLLSSLTPSSNYRAVVWNSLLCYNCPVPAPIVSSPSSSSTSSQPQSAASSGSTTSPSSTAPSITSTQSTASPSVSAAAVSAACVRADAPLAAANCNVKGFHQPGNSTQSTNVYAQADCAAYCLSVGAACKSWTWVPASGLCGIYSLNVWDAIGDSAVAGRAYKDNVMDEPGCWTCPTGVTVHYVPV
ncbi:hypothetical protein CkaCkLH20_12990 [Colletotrichum karsti]|uniref:Uncharacterized protein n=1 Tax=Colletotrichum karsti TaxID=1095194 RepID=A0A9P6LEF6_9PEZI|nr:uncharacterized protein CkaCkLH20_12990 [Colletotrichum karsti]KAF9869505.1 hypothetical protein CkaCkLH20_12990 [Colletotrichum karsti]